MLSDVAVEFSIKSNASEEKKTTSEQRGHPSFSQYRSRWEVTAGDSLLIQWCSVSTDIAQQEKIVELSIAWHDEEGCKGTELNAVEVQPQFHPLCNVESSTFVAYGTEFQCRVWDVLRTIPYGERVSYQWVAERLGCKGVRAVATAIGRNPLALLIPCHRVVRSTGALGGYRWGMDLKALLLRLESA